MKNPSEGSEKSQFDTSFSRPFCLLLGQGVQLREKKPNLNSPGGD